MFCRIFDLLRPSLPLPSRQGESRNVLVLGSLGVGKSSLVNMLVGRSVAPVSGNIGVAHAAVVEHAVPLDTFEGVPLRSTSRVVLRFYDTVGLEHRPSPWRAIKARVKRRGGPHLVLYCMRRGRLTSEQVKHLRDIWATYCSGGVPLLLVITGVDFRRGSTEKWWETNGEDLVTTVQIEFTDRICLNTCDPAHPSWRNHDMGYEESQRLARELVVRHCKDLDRSV